jgi:hypothetical protein
LAAQQVNAEGWPALDRSSESLKKATAGILKALQEVRQEWDEWSDSVARTSVVLIAGHWLLAGASLTAPGAWAKHIANVPLQCEAEKRTLLEDAMDGKKLLALLVAEVIKY